MTSGSSLREYDRPADRIRLHRGAVKRPVLIVEGPDDELVLRPHLDGVDIFPVDGKGNAEQCAQQLASWGFESFACVTDRDFDDTVVPSEIQHAHLHYDGRDLESMLIALGVLAKVLTHQGSRAKLESLGGADEVVDRLSDEVGPIGALRQENSRNGWGLAFDAVDLADKIDPRTLRLKANSYGAALVTASTTSITNADVQKVLTEGTCSEPRGKDVVAAVGAALRRAAGTLDRAACREGVLTAQLHSSCDLALERSAWLERLRKILGLI